MNGMDASAYAFVHGIRSTRGTLEAWNRRPWPVLSVWLLGSLAAATALLLAVWLIAAISSGAGVVPINRPPLVTGGSRDVLRGLERNSLVLPLHAMASVAGFIAGSSLPLQAPHRTGVIRVIHERGGRLAIAFVICATTFSLTGQAYVLGHSVARVAHTRRPSPGLLLAGLLPHALVELTALFLPLAAWIIASRRGQWHQLLAATFVTVAIAVPVLVASAVVEVYVSPHLVRALAG